MSATDHPSNSSLLSHFEFRCVRPEEISQAIEIEQTCFPPREACSPEHMRERIAAAPELFLAAIDRNTSLLAGSMNGIAADAEQFRDAFFTDSTLHRPEGKNIMVTGLAVLPSYRRRGLARELVREYVRRARRTGRKELILTCRDSLVPMYEKFGFEDQGLSVSTWGGIPWHEMTYRL